MANKLDDGADDLVPPTPPTEVEKTGLTPSPAKAEMVAAAD
jgi:hypothetical protein